MPSEDIKIWRASLYLAKCFSEGKKGQTAKLKEDIMLRFGEKGRNIANLCSAGYLDTYLRPLSEAIKNNEESEEAVKKRFLEIYSMIITSEPFTLFVNKRMSSETIKGEIENKRKYGHKFLNVHGIGKENKKNIKEVVDYFKENDSVKTSMNDEGKMIVVKFLFVGEKNTHLQ